MTIPLFCAACDGWQVSTVAICEGLRPAREAHTTALATLPAHPDVRRTGLLFISQHRAGCGEATQ